MSKRTGSYLGGSTIIKIATAGIPNHQGPPPRSAAEQKALDDFAATRLKTSILIKAANHRKPKNKKRR